MQDHELRELWARQDEKLDRCLRLNEEHLRAAAVGGAQTSLSYHILFRVIELLLGALALLFLGSFLADHATEPRFLAAAGALHVFAAGIVGFLVYELVLIGRLDYSGPVTDIQRAVERIELVEYRSFKWTLFGGVLLWVLVPIVLFEAAFGVDLFEELPPAWIAANLVLGLVLLAVGQTWLSRYVEREGARPWAKRFVDHMSGRSLRRARAFLAELSGFEREAG